MMNIRRVPALSLFKTKAFREHWWIRLLCEEIGDVFVTDDPSPGGSFTTYFRVITRRKTNQRSLRKRTHNDLYYLHELRHLRGFLRRAPIDNWYKWQMAMGESELDASLTSECVVHFLIPKARVAFRGQVIWVDRYLEDPAFRCFMGQTDLEEIGILRGRLMTERIRALSTPKHNDYIEYQIRNYGLQNMAWYVIWAKPVGYGPYENIAAWRVVEEHFARPDWADHHQKWLDAVSDGTAFRNQAAAFERVYKQSNEDFGNWPFAT